RAEPVRVPVRGATFRAEAGGIGTVELEHPLEGQQLRVDPLQLGRFRGEDVDPDVVANRHLVEGAAEVGLHDRELLEQAVPLPAQVEILRLRRRGGLLLLFPHPDPFAETAKAAHGSAPEGSGGALSGSPPTVITSGRFFWVLM